MARHDKYGNQDVSDLHDDVYKYKVALKMGAKSIAKKLQIKIDMLINQKRLDRVAVYGQTTDAMLVESAATFVDPREYEWRQYQEPTKKSKLPNIKGTGSGIAAKGDYFGTRIVGNKVHVILFNEGYKTVFQVSLDGGKTLETRSIPVPPGTVDQLCTKLKPPKLDRNDPVQRLVADLPEWNDGLKNIKHDDPDLQEFCWIAYETLDYIKNTKPGSEDAYLNVVRKATGIKYTDSRTTARLAAFGVSKWLGLYRQCDKVFSLQPEKLAMWQQKSDQECKDYCAMVVAMGEATYVKVMKNPDLIFKLWTKKVYKAIDTAFVGVGR